VIELIIHSNTQLSKKCNYISEDLQLYRIRANLNFLRDNNLNLIFLRDNNLMGMKCMQGRMQDFDQGAIIGL
jgi:hypothetical protein